GDVVQRKFPQARLIEAHERRIHRAEADAVAVATGDGHAGIQAEQVPVPAVNDVLCRVYQRAEAGELEAWTLYRKWQAKPAAFRNRIGRLALDRPLHVQIRLRFVERVLQRD